MRATRRTPHADPLRRYTAALSSLLSLAGCAEPPAAPRDAATDAPTDTPTADVVSTDTPTADAVSTDATAVDVPAVPPTAWVRVFDASFLMTPSALAVARDGTVCVAGDFQGDLRVTGQSVTSSGASDGFASCFAPDGALRFLFATRAPGEDGFSAAALNADGLLVAGQIPSSATVGGVALSTAGGIDVVLARFDLGGRVTRAITLGGSGSDQPTALATDARGHVYVTGSSDQDLRVGAITLRNEGRNHAWLVELDASLAPLRARSFPAGFEAHATALRVGDDGTVTLGGHFSGSLRIGATSLGPTRAQDVFVARLRPDDSVAWAQRYGDSADDRLHDLAVTADGAVLLAGSSGLGRFAFGADAFTIEGASDGWIARASSTGEPVWARRVGGAADDRALSLYADDGGGVAVGRFDRTLSLGDASLTAAGASDGWRARFDPSGALRPIARYGGEGPDVATRVAAAPGGSVTLGSFAGSAEVAGETLRTVGIGGAFMHRAVE